MTKIEILKQALVEITKGEGAYSKDPLKHAENCINNMIKIATDALSKVAPPIKNNPSKTNSK